MSARAHKVDRVGLNLVNQQKIAANMAFPVIGPFPFQWVIEPFRAKGRIIGDQQHHRFFESHQIKTPRVR